MTRLIAVLRTLCAGSAAAGQEALRVVSVGSGEPDGGYYAAADALCDRVNRVDPGRLRCSPEATPGSAYNIRALLAGELDFALVQSDLAAAAAATPEGAALRLVAWLYDEPLTLIARREAAVRRFPDLRGRRVDLGHPASGRRATMAAALAAFGMGPDDFAETFELQTGAVAAALCEGRIDAAALTVGHPSAAVARALADCDTALVPVEGQAVEALVAAQPALALAAIPGGLYRGHPAPTPTFGVRALLLTTADADAAAVALLAATLRDELPLMARRAPALGGVAREAPRAADALAPPHPAAAPR